MIFRDCRNLRSAMKYLWVEGNVLSRGIALRRCGMHRYLILRMLIRNRLNSLVDARDC